MDTLIIIGILVLTFITRAVNLLSIPIFTDEAIYIRWAQIGLADPAHRYISLSDGKQPLFAWLMYPFLMIFSDPLFAGRLVSVLCALGTVAGIYLLSRQLLGKKAAIFASVLYIFSPFTSIYDRLALMDSLLATTAVWSLYLQIKLVKKLQLDSALLLGMVMGLGLLTKSSAIFFLLLMPIAIILFDFRKSNLFKRLLRWLSLSFMSIIIAQIMYNSLRLSPLFYIIEQKNYSFVLTMSEFVKKPFVLFPPNLYGLVNILISYLTIPVFVAVLVGLYFSLVEKNRAILFLFVWFAIPFLALAAYGKVIFPRFILFMTMPLFVIAGDALAKLYNYFNNKRVLYIITVILLIWYPLYQSLLIIISPVEVNIPRSDRNQLFDDWPSGFGVNEVIDYLKVKAKTSPIVVATEGTFGLNPAVYEIYLEENKNITIHGFWPVNEVPAQLIESARKYPTYLIFKEKQVIPSDWPLKLLKKIKRGKGDTYLLFYQVTPNLGPLLNGQDNI